MHEGDHQPVIPLVDFRAAVRMPYTASLRLEKVKSRTLMAGM